MLVVKFCVFVEVCYLSDDGVVVFEEEGEELFALRGEGEGAGGGVWGGRFGDVALGAEISNDVGEVGLLAACEGEELLLGEGVGG